MLAAIKAMGFASAQPILVIAKPNIVGAFRKECSAADGHPRQSGWRSDRTRPEQFVLPRSLIVVSTFIGPGWLPEQLGSLHKAGSTKMTQISIATAGIDTAKDKLDV